MTQFTCLRKVRKVGGSAYIALPRLARIELRIFMNDFVALELDTKRKILILRPVKQQPKVPMINLDEFDMLPLDDGASGKEAIAVAAGADVAELKKVG